MGAAGQFIFQHPFTMLVSGPTSCGKTTFVKNLLENNLACIYPPPERILWLYNRWQPLYDEMLHIHPQIEFIRGIPVGLDRDDYFQSDANNLVVLDDLMSVASKDPRITDLFTEGSHHRNLSVICINQNLYASKDPTQRRNCQYLVLFKNPIDQQQVATLARQMYPGKSQYFLEEFAKATDKPFSYLLIDLKPTTPESHRLQSNVLPLYSTGSRLKPGKDCESTKSESNQTVIKVDEVVLKDHLHSDHQTVNNIPESPAMADTSLHPCADCGQVFETRYDMNRHVKRWCPVNDGDDEVPTKKMKTDESCSDIEDSSGFDTLINKVYKENNDKYQSKVEFYEDQDMSEHEAEMAAKEAMLPQDRRLLMKIYKNLVTTFHKLQCSALHRNIIAQVQYMVGEKNYDFDHALDVVVGKHWTEFNQLVESDTEEQCEDSIGSENSESSSQSDTEEQDEESTGSENSESPSQSDTEEQGEESIDSQNDKKSQWGGEVKKPSPPPPGEPANGSKQPRVLPGLQL